jgi:3-dehydroquinate dehydratase / shikimate dehydrogenase
VDLETDIADQIRRFGPVKLIVSYHNMEETPADLPDIYERMLKQDADVYKIAVMAHHPGDCARVMSLQRTAPKPTVAFCMGEVGFPTRFIAVKAGAPWTFAGFNRERSVASGLPAFEDVRRNYHVRSVGPDTKIFGLLGDPVGHSYSPILHNALFRKLKVDALYLPFRVPKGTFQSAVAAYGAIPVDGYSVTIPHKEDAAALNQDGPDPTVRLTGAANTLIRRPEGGFTAYNTDFSAATESLRDHMASLTDGPNKFDQLFVLILGAGGVARAIAHSLHKEGAHVTITARNGEKAARLAAEVQCKSTDWYARHAATHCNVVINCTPVGMHPNVDDSPLHASVLRPGLIVFDTIYNPENTMLITEARTRGCHVVTGLDMFARQAAKQFELFTGIAPPVGPMRDFLRKAMSPVTGALDDEDLEDKESDDTDTDEPADGEPEND